MRLNRFQVAAVLMVTTSTIGGMGCTSAYKRSVGAEDAPPYVSRIFLTDFNTGWQSILDALKHSPLDVSNREGGYVQTKWTDNTAERNFVDSFGNQDTFLKAQYRFRVTLAKGFYNGQPSVRIQVHKDQLVERDVLEGWRTVNDSDPVDENTLLYRIGRLIYMKMKLGIIEEQRAKEQLPPPGVGEPPPDIQPDDGNPPPDIQPDAPPPSSKDKQELEILENQ